MIAKRIGSGREGGGGKGGGGDCGKICQPHQREISSSVACNCTKAAMNPAKRLKLQHQKDKVVNPFQNFRPKRRWLIIIAVALSSYKNFFLKFEGACNIFYMTAEKGKGEGMGMGGDYEQSITNVTGYEPWWHEMEDSEQGWSLGGSICNCVPLATGELAVAFEETNTAGGAELEGYRGWERSATVCW